MKLLHITSIFLAFWLCLAPSLQAQPEASNQSQNPVEQAEALLKLSGRQNYDNHALALQTAQQALGLWVALANNEGIARTYVQIGRCYFAQSALTEAKQSYEMALGLWRELNNPQQQAEMLITLGYIEDRKGEWANSISLFTEARSLIDEENAPFTMGMIFNGLGDVFNESGLPEEALVQYQRALDYVRQTPDLSDDTMTIWAIGTTYHLLGNNTEALTHLQQALAGVAPDGLYAALCSEYLGRVHTSMGELPAALQYLQTALTIYTRAGNPSEEARVRGLLGQAYQQQGKLESARQNYLQALTTFRELSDGINQAALYYALGRLDLRSGNYDAAEDYLRRSIEATENIRRIPMSSDLTAAFTASVYERYECYIDCLMRKHQAEPAQGFAIRAFETSEVARARSLAELLRATQTNLIEGLDPNLAEQEKSLRQALKVKEDYKVALLGKAYKKEELVALDTELARLQEEYKQVNETIRASYPSYEQITKPTAWDLRRIQEQVISDDQTVLLEYSLGSEQSYVWAVTRDGIKSYNLPPRARVNDAAQKVYKLLAAIPGPDTAKELTPALGDLSRLVLSPFAQELGKRRIIIVADGALHYIPFQVLPTPSANNEPLVANYEIVTTPSASILGELRKEATRRQPEKVLAAFGNPEFQKDYAQSKEATGGEQSIATPAVETARLHHALRNIELSRDSFDPSAVKPLFHARRELAYLREAASGGEVFVASEDTASRELLLRTDLTDYAILHFATHGLLDPRRPENSGLVLSTVDSAGRARNGFVGLQDIYGLRAPVDLVVLSACQTALGKDVRGEGLLGLTRGFMYAGASSVVASLWKVDDEATAELMRQFYINMLREQMTPADALRAAQNSIRQKPEWNAPYYWAGFTLQGEYRQVIKPATAAGFSGIYWMILIGGALMLLIGVALWLRRRTGSYSTMKK